MAPQRGEVRVGLFAVAPAIVVSIVGVLFALGVFLWRVNWARRVRRAEAERKAGG